MARIRANQQRGHLYDNRGNYQGCSKLSPEGAQQLIDSIGKKRPREKTPAERYVLPSDSIGNRDPFTMRFAVKQIKYNDERLGLAYDQIEAQSKEIKALKRSMKKQERRLDSSPNRKVERQAK